MPVEAPERTILQLPQLVGDRLDVYQRRVFERNFEVEYGEAPVVYPTEEAREKVTKLFGIPVDARKGLSVTNSVLGEQTFDNPLRANRPLRKVNSSKTIAAYQTEEPNLPENCFFCHPDVSTPQDPFGPVKFGRAMTVANAAAYTPWNSLAIPVGVHDPSKIDEELLSDLIHTGNEWFKKAREYNPRLIFPFMGANVLYRAGGSQMHPHLQLITTPGILQQTRNIQERTRNYQDLHGYPYFDELAYCLRPLGLVRDVDTAHIVFNIVPKKEKEVFIYTNSGSGLPNGDLSRAAFKVIEWWREALGVTSFNLAVYMPPLDIDVREEGPWHNFFPIMRIVERGQEGNRTSDIGVMEMYAASVVASDPFKLVESYDGYHREKAAA